MDKFFSVKVNQIKSNESSSTYMLAICLQRFSTFDISHLVYSFFFWVSFLWFPFPRVLQTSVIDKIYDGNLRWGSFESSSVRLWSAVVIVTKSCDGCTLQNF